MEYLGVEIEDGVPYPLETCIDFERPLQEQWDLFGMDIAYITYEMDDRRIVIDVEFARWAKSPRNWYMYIYICCYLKNEAHELIEETPRRYLISYGQSLDDLYLMLKSAVEHVKKMKEVSLEDLTSLAITDKEMNYIPEAGNAYRTFMRTKKVTIFHK